MATGDILCWLNSDDVYFPWTMRVVARIFSDFPQIQWIMGVRCELRDRAVQGISNVTPFPREIIRSGAFHPRGLGCIMQEGCFWRRSLYEKVGGISVEWPFSGDYELWLRFAAHTDLVVTTALLGGFNHTGKNRSQLNPDTWQEEVVAIRQRIPAPLRKMGDRLAARKAFAQKFLFGKPRLRRYLQSWLCLTMHRGPCSDTMLRLIATCFTVRSSLWPKQRWSNYPQMDADERRLKTKTPVIEARVAEKPWEGEPPGEPIIYGSAGASPSPGA